MMEPDQLDRPPLLLVELRRFVRLRWVAGAVVVLGTMASSFWQEWTQAPERILVVGAVILALNFLFWASLRRYGRADEQMKPGRLLVVAWVQLLLDLACLTLLVVWTRGITSPLLLLFVLHMVFASLLLPLQTSYLAAAAAIVMVGSGLWLTDQWPSDQATTLSGLGWMLALLATVYLTNHISKGLRENETALRRQQDALVQHEKMAAMGQMAAGVAHEISNPLAGMDSLLQLVERYPDRMGPETIQALREQVARVSRLVKQMTEFAHPIESGWETVPLNDVVISALDIIQYDNRLKRVEVVRELSNRAGQLRLMPHAMQQVLVNLIVNALEAMAETDKPKLEVRTKRDGQWCVIELSDNGHGIQPQHLGRIFEPFFTTKPVGQGTGLGLSISYNLIKRHDGRCEVHSEPGRGTTFSIHLPASS